MSQERLSMRKIKEVLRLRYEKGLSHRAIGRSCGIGCTTARESVVRAQAAGLSWPRSKPPASPARLLHRCPPNAHRPSATGLMLTDASSVTLPLCVFKQEKKSRSIAASN